MSQFDPILIKVFINNMKDFLSSFYRKPPHRNSVREVTHTCDTPLILSRLIYIYNVLISFIFRHLVHKMVLFEVANGFCLLLYTAFVLNDISLLKFVIKNNNF